jgi:hypothetical protein
LNPRCGPHKYNGLFNLNAVILKERDSLRWASRAHTKAEVEAEAPFSSRPVQPQMVVPYFEQNVLHLTRSRISPA